MSAEHILIIDDSIAIASLLANEILPLGGYRATAALSGEEGLDIIQELEPDLILCDLEMPGISGLDVLRTLQNEGLNVPAIMMTAFGSEAIAAQALRLGVKDYIIKPFTTEEILASVERALIESRLRVELEDLNTALDEQRQALMVMQAVNQATRVGLDPEDLLSRIILAAVYGGKAQGGFIAKLNSQSSQLDVRAVANLPNWEVKRIDVKAGSALDKALKTGQVVKSKSETGYWFYVPFIRYQSAIGLMAVAANLKELPPHTDHLFSVLACYAAYILENSQLRSELAVAMLQGKQQL